MWTRKGYGPFPHPLIERIKRLRVPLWKLRYHLGGSPSESKLSRMLRGIDPMPGWMSREIARSLDLMEFGEAEIKRREEEAARVAEEIKARVEKIADGILAGSSDK